jgi:hypothetical protein
MIKYDKIRRKREKVPAVSKIIRKRERASGISSEQGTEQFLLGNRASKKASK